VHLGFVGSPKVVTFLFAAPVVVASVVATGLLIVECCFWTCCEKPTKFQLWIFRRFYCNLSTRMLRECYWKWSFRWRCSYCRHLQAPPGTPKHLRAPPTTR